MSKISPLIVAFLLLYVSCKEEKKETSQPENPLAIEVRNEMIRSWKEKDYLVTYFYAETLKYFYIAFAGKDVFDFDAHIFNTEAHSFRRDSFDPELAKIRLGYEK